MRDKKRIEKILNLIKRVWKKYPDWRFGQLLINLKIVPDDSWNWLMEDNDLETQLKKRIKELPK